MGAVCARNALLGSLVMLDGEGEDLVHAVRLHHPVGPHDQQHPRHLHQVSGGGEGQLTSSASKMSEPKMAREICRWATGSRVPVERTRRERRVSGEVVPRCFPPAPPWDSHIYLAQAATMSSSCLVPHLH